MLALTLGACGGGSAKDDEKTTIEFMHSSVEQDRLKVIDKLVADFEKKNPDIKVKQIPVEEDAYNTKVVTLARSNKLPGVIEVSQDFAKVMDKDELIDQKAVGSVMEKVGEDNYYDGAKKLVRTEDGSGYIAAPISGWVQGIWYNKKTLSDAGFSEPTTWESVLEIAKHFNDAGNKKYGIAMPTADSTMTEQAFSQFALSNDANVLDEKGKVTINTPEMTKALEYYKELSQYTMPGSNDVTEIKDAFMNGSVPMAIYSTYILPSVFEEGKAEDIGFAIPTNKQEAVYGTVSGLTISAGLDKEQKAASEKFVEYLSEAKNMEKWVLMSPGGAQPVNKKVVDSSSYQSNEVISAFGDLPKEIASSFDKVQVFGLVGDKNFTKMGDITSSGAISKAVNSATVGKEAPEKALKTAQDSIEK
ncbi:sugar ABC transporter substrate-binding protein [Enterococcus hulanensis]|uniref:Sugar ABC transporter substrate-binding protein n=2 Tax=Enterococcus hulanensis TaxID=2559929 RepID=A0ABU3EUT4_9ENTE|nr:sugar ABC transporter substrate-binding protein [Enterococcus hulanensis]MDT2598639.1 sugar ABC transporter substrate-binding protein [Enterococcus hulanensis]MDT2607856.1 sugar ABC transporter substrate-binding protein [Enterococcus hulanensis]MDT2615151.1 sugar ABC transporter substrate-binding protein [Enterococcus hulanensis]MDT2626878.1 sugar ABC transporter substrate-binding protein [Enterococcus hulanensis]MDT2654223.1 sugar ABC transporter substrate-binding protein [Enterococcus hul